MSAAEAASRFDSLLNTVSIPVSHFAGFNAGVTIHRRTQGTSSGSWLLAIRQLHSSQEKTLIILTLQPNSVRHKSGSKSRDDVSTLFLFHFVHQQPTHITNTGSVVEFVDETRKVIYEAATPDSGLDEIEPDLESPILSEHSLLREFSQPFLSEAPNGQENPRQFLSREQTLPESPRLSEIASEALSLRGSVQPPETASSAAGHARGRSPSDRFIPRPVPGSYHELYYSTDSAFPIKDREEADLYMHYVQSLAPWVSTIYIWSMNALLMLLPPFQLDLCDPLRSFETVVPQKAANFPLLLKAIYSFSARHKSLTGTFDSVKSSVYYGECLGELQAVLASYDESGADENLFAATIILRVLEEIDGMKPSLACGRYVLTTSSVVDNGTDREANLLGIHAFVSTGSFFKNPKPLSVASFWVGLRQGIYKAVINKRPVGLSVDHNVVEESLKQTDYHSVANNAVVHCTRVLNFCFDKGGTCNIEEWKRLWKAIDDWEKVNLAFHTPLYKDPYEVPFPQIWYHQSCQGMLTCFCHRFLS